jgi:hypothetical protein
MSCPVCSNSMQHSFFAEVLGKYQADYESCNTCGYLRIRDPHWLEEAYTNAIANADTGLVMRNITLANKISRILYWLTNHKSQNRYLDAAGGYGMLTRMMRDNGFDFYWADKYCDNLVARGFEYSKSLGPCSAATAIEVLEHVTDPVAFFEEIISFSGASTLIFTTELFEGVPPKPNDWWYYSLATGQHIGFFQKKTLAVIASKLSLNFVSANGVHVLSKLPINKFVFNIITNNYFSLFPAFLIRRFLGTKTLIDHEVMMSKIVDLKF